MIGILFVNNFILFIIALILFPLINDKVDIIKKSLLSIVMGFIINSLIIFVYSFFSLKCPLLHRAILFIILSIILFVYILKTRNTQKFSFKLKNVFAVLFILVLTLLLANYRFKENGNLIFETTDPAAHYSNAHTFSVSNQLIEKLDEKDYYYNPTNESTLFLGYTSVGTLFQIESSLNFGHYTFVYTFIAFELAVIFFTGCFLYFCVENHIKKNSFFSYVFILLSLLLCIAGYPFNHLIFGYHYLGICILIILILIDMYKYIITSKKNWGYIIFVALLMFSTFTSYYMIAPVIFGAYGVTILFDCFVRKKIEFKNSCLLILEILLIPFIIGVGYYIIRNRLFVTNNVADIDAFKTEGYIYRNLIGNFAIVLLPVVVKIIGDFKRKEFRISSAVLIFVSIYFIILFISFYNDSIASYYFYKLHYLLWPICFLILDEAICSLDYDKTLSLFAKCITTFLFIIFVVEIKDIDEHLYKKNPLLNPAGFASGLADVYHFNEVKIDKKNKPIYTNEQLKDIIDLINNNKMENEKIIFYGDLFEKLWFYNFSKLNPNGGVKGLFAFYEENKAFDEIIKDNNMKYVICKIDECSSLPSDYYDNKYKNSSFELYERVENVKIKTKKK